MKILEEGKKWSIQSRCAGIGINGGGCGALIELEDDDIEVVLKLTDSVVEDEMYTEREYSYTFKCPCCNIESEINEDLPVLIREKVLARTKDGIKKIRLNNRGRMYL